MRRAGRFPQAGEMVVTPREVDALVERMSGVLADGINQALQPNLTSRGDCADDGAIERGGKA